MSKKDLLSHVEHSLCCPEGICRAIASGDPKACGAPQTKAHAEAAIEFIQEEHQKWLDALIAIRNFVSSSPYEGDRQTILRMISDAIE